jgi:hypothetical protein
VTSTPAAKRMPEMFWGEIAPCEHVVQIYNEDRAVLDALEGFVSGGLRARGSAIVIATEGHRKAQRRRRRRRPHHHRQRQRQLPGRGSTP